jgi:hypothetical protein
MGRLLVVEMKDHVPTTGKIHGKPVLPQKVQDRNGSFLRGALQKFDPIRRGMVAVFREWNDVALADRDRQWIEIMIKGIYGNEGGVYCYADLLPREPDQRKVAGEEG